MENPQPRPKLCAQARLLRMARNRRVTTNVNYLRGNYGMRNEDRHWKAGVGRGVDIDGESAVN